jgi:NitT/TauT family transport system substrate-binding protein
MVHPLREPEPVETNAVKLMKRSTFVTTALAAASATPVFAQTPAPLALRFSGTGADDIASYLYAQKAGLFRAAGFDTTYERANSGAATVAAVVGGAVDVGKSSMGSLITARARNINLKIHAGGALFRSSNTRGEVLLVVAADSPLKTAKDFAGKTISVPALGDQNVMAARAWVDSQGGDSKALQFVEIPSSAAAAAIAQGRVAGSVLVPPFAARAISDGKMRSVATVFTAIAPRFLETAWFTTADYALKHRDQLQRFSKIMSDASVYVNAHSPEIADILAPFTGFTSASILDNGISYLANSVDVRDIQPLIDAMAKYGLIQARFDAADFLVK